MKITLPLESLKFESQINNTALCVFTNILNSPHFTLIPRLKSRDFFLFIFVVYRERDLDLDRLMHFLCVCLSSSQPLIYNFLSFQNWCYLFLYLLWALSRWMKHMRDGWTIKAGEDPFPRDFKRKKKKGERERETNSSSLLLLFHYILFGYNLNHSITFQ